MNETINTIEFTEADCNRRIFNSQEKRLLAADRGDDAKRLWQERYDRASPRGKTFMTMDNTGIDV